MVMGIISEIGEFPTLEMLVGVLEATDCELTSLWAIDGNDEEYQRAYERHWSVREAINAVPARTFSELKAKARAAEIELERDAADCEGPGSFVELARSFIEDVKAMQPIPMGLGLPVVSGARG